MVGCSSTLNPSHQQKNKSSFSDFLLTKLKVCDSLSSHYLKMPFILYDRSMSISFMSSYAIFWL